MSGEPARDHIKNGKEYGAMLEKLQRGLDVINEEINVPHISMLKAENITMEFLNDDNYSNVENLEEKLTQFKAKFIECDSDLSGDLDLMDLKYMLEKLGQPKTHLELKKLIKQVDKNNSGTINYHEFILMMLGKTSVLKMIFLFEDKNKEADRPTGIPPPKSIHDLP